MRSLLVSLSLLLLACGSPDTPDGDECGPNHPSCPTGFTCNPVSMRCMKTSTVIDGSVVDTPDAAVMFDARPPTPDAPAPSADATPPAALGVMPGSHSFGPITLGGTSAPFEFRITNNGAQQSGVIAAGLSDNTNYAVSGPGCIGTRLGPGASCSVFVQLQPIGQAGDRNATLTITADPGGPATASLGGSAVTAANLTFLTTTFSFGNVGLGTDSPEKLLMLKNGGGTATPALSFSATAPYRISSNNCPSMLGAGAECAIGVVFKPTALGAAPSGTLTAGSATAMLGGTGTATLTVNLAGGGEGIVMSQPSGITCGTTCSATYTSSPVVLMATSGQRTQPVQWSKAGCSGSECSVALDAAQVAVTATFNLDPIMMTLSPVTSIFDSIFVNDASAPSMFMVTNEGGATTGPIFTGLNSSEYEIVDNTCLNESLAGGEYCMLSVVFKPVGAPGTRTATLQVRADPGDDLYATLSGTAQCRGGDQPCVATENCCPGLYCQFGPNQCWNIVQ